MEKTIKLLLIVACMAIAVPANAQNVNAPGGQTTNAIPKWNPGAAFTLTNSQISDNIDVKIATGSLDVSAAFNQGYKIATQPVLTYRNSTTNIFVGVGAGNVTTGTENTFMGNNAGLINVAATYNTFIGSKAGLNQQTGGENTYIGYSAGAGPGLPGPYSSGGGNVCVGVLAGSGNITGGSNVIVGYLAGINNNASFNTFIGAGAGNANVVGIGNVFLGYQSGFNTANTASTGNNTLIGYESGFTNTLGTDNSFLGYHSGFTNDRGEKNVFVGNISGNGMGFGYSFNTCLGYNTGTSNPSIINNVTAIGYNARVETSNTMVLGDNNVNVGIGLSTSLIGPLAKFHVFRDNKGSVTNPTAVYVDNIDKDKNNYLSTGIRNITHGNNTYNVGIFSEAYNADDNLAGKFYAVYSTNAQNTGGLFRAEQAPVNFGVIGLAPIFNEATTFNVGVYGEAPRDAANFASPGAGSYAGYFDGDLAYTGLCAVPSDSNIKTNIQQFTNAASILQQINCYTYNYDSTKYGDHVHLPKTIQYGFLAQEVKLAAPGLVKDGNLPPKLDSLGHVVIAAQPVEMVDYVRMVPLLQQGYREQQTVIDSLITRLTDLEATVATCCASNRSSNNSNPERTGQNEILNVKLQNIENIILYTNEPNPYTSSTTIRFFIPENVHDVKITFQDATGKTLKEVPISEAGQGSINVDGSELISGTYTYSLVVSGRIIDTKKMVKVK